MKKFDRTNGSRTIRGLSNNRSVSNGKVKRTPSAMKRQMNKSRATADLRLASVHQSIRQLLIGKIDSYKLIEIMTNKQINITDQMLGLLDRVDAGDKSISFKDISAEIIIDLSNEPTIPQSNISCKRPSRSPV